MPAYMSHKYNVQRAFFIELMGGECRRCKSTTKLEIDHIDPSKKTMQIGLLFGKGQILAAVHELITQCQILCKKCHTEKTKSESRRFNQPLKHGSMYVWMNLNCPCEPCTRSRWMWYDKRNARRRSGGVPYKTNREAHVFGQPLPDDCIRPIVVRKKKISTGR
jgi:hypothetical protein